MNLYSLFLKSFNKNKKIVFNNEEVSYSLFKEYINAFASHLEDKNIKKVAILSSNPKLLAVALFACAKEGKIIITLNKNLLFKQINLQLKLTKPDLIIVDKINAIKKIKYYKKFINQNDVLKTKKKMIIKNKKPKNFLKKDFIITLSSGTTSEPKPIIYDQKTKYLRFLQMRSIYKIKSGDDIFSVSPLDHSLGQRLLFLALLNGSNFIFLNKYDLKIIKKYSSKFKLKFSSLSSNYLILLKKNLINKSVIIKKIVSAASTLPDYDKKILIENKVNLYEMYGAAEIGTVTNINFNKNRNLVGSVGKILKNIDIKIVNEKNQFLNRGMTGEIVCKTPLRFKGYYNNKKLTKKSFIGKYFKTGDIGKLDNRNNLYFLSRKQDVIISGGKNIYPIDVEKELLKLKYIKEAAVIGLKDKFFGEIVFAVCVARSTQLNIENKIKKDLSIKLSTFQMPLGFAFEKRLPKNNLGKIKKYLLRKKYNEKKFDFTKNLRRILN
jgi:acyl-CoA synthetase (AMP-forming)/AMP-acid ligase II